ncbi:hypothetical protein VHEMI03919 [[Torrubiella] hemipterigena]|uniref:Helicase C-terminal domain-containing protein n=1 Tax=[Torrubiella] hemipterigena TaxID=1531966 RepID=A0A0A1SZU1_9HYPO|nr:hypothetical protein VHEMI03919 [[Torrubiella] hemipterigena]
MNKAHFIAAGCVALPKTELGLDDDLWKQLSLAKWNILSTTVSSDDTSAAAAVSTETLSAFLKAPRFLAYRELLEAQWAYLEFGVSDICPDTGILRISLLPDDVHRSSIDRTNARAWVRRRQLVSEMDYSTEAWDGVRLPVAFSGPIPVDPAAASDEEASSLLELFNQMPSPSPSLEVVEDVHARRQMKNVLDGKIPGLITKLHPHQKRSVATMLQKEAQPGRMPDPRLLCVKSPCGPAWYLDRVSGEACSQQRYYDEVRGGILAEEMGSGKTLICLALILATLESPSVPPDLYNPPRKTVRKKVGSLCDMAAACATRHSVPWKTYFGQNSDFGNRFHTDLFKRNPGCYFVPPPKPRRSLRLSAKVRPSRKMYLSTCSLVIVPNNLLSQWQDEIRKHTTGLKVLVIKKDDFIPPTESLLEQDIILMSQSRFEAMHPEFETTDSPLSFIRFKRCFVDEGHVLGNSSINRRSNLLMGLEVMSFFARWAVTGTPSKGLHSVDAQDIASSVSSVDRQGSSPHSGNSMDKSQLEMESKDLERIGSIAVLYLQARPWAKLSMESDDNASWTTYLMLPRHRRSGRGRWDCLKATLSSLIVRHQISDVQYLLPSIEEKVVMLDGSYQDQLAVNIFSMIIIFNAVQSERTDLDYFFHPKQRKNLLLMVHNLKQTSFFGGSFFSWAEIKTAVETAEEFLQKKAVSVSKQDEYLLQDAIEFGHLIMKNEIRNHSNIFHELPVCVTGFPAGAGYAWSLDGMEADTICTSASMLHSLQKRIFKAACKVEEFNSLMNGGLIEEGLLERQKHMDSASSPKKTKKAIKGNDIMAGNTKLGDDSPRKAHPRPAKDDYLSLSISDEVDLSPLMDARITSTVSAKLTYLIDSLLMYQDDEKIIIFYENENIAWYLAGMLDVLQIQHLIYAKSLTVERRAHYVSTFHYNHSFRVLLMDLSQAAFGLDMRIASRIYFINPVLNPQVQAQAIGRVRRISQQKPVSVETLVLRGSIDEVLLDQQQHMTQAEHRRAKSILDITPIYNWIKNAKIAPMDTCDANPESQMAPLTSPLPVFGVGFGRTVNPNDGLVVGDYMTTSTEPGARTEDATAPANDATSLDEKINDARGGDQSAVRNGGQSMKRTHAMGPGSNAATGDTTDEEAAPTTRPARRVRFDDGA